MGAGPNWLLFGERNAAHDLLYGDELQAWQQGGVLQRLDLAFSRDAGGRVYVQDRLRQAGEELRQWVVGQGAAIYVCGSLQGMAQGWTRPCTSCWAKRSWSNCCAAAATGAMSIDGAVPRPRSLPQASLYCYRVCLWPA